MRNVVTMNTSATHLQVLETPPHFKHGDTEQRGKFKLFLSHHLRSLASVMHGLY